MSKLSAFLNPIYTSEEKEIIVSDRFVKRGEDGEPLLDKNGKMIPEPFKIRALTQEEMSAAVKKATRQIRNKGQVTEQLDNTALARYVIVAGTVSPNFSSQEMCEHYGVVDPSFVPAKMLFAGEHAKLSDAIMELSGYDGEDAAEEAKN